MKNKKIGFTVIELLTVIAIIMIFVLGISNFNFKSISDKQNLEILTNSIISQIETVRTNALIGKGVLIDGILVVPKYRKIEFLKVESGTGITINYKIDDLATDWIEDKSTLLGKFTSISKIICTNEDGVGIGTIQFEGNKYTLTDGCLSNFTTITIDIQYKNFTETIEFNTINGLVEKVKK